MRTLLFISHFIYCIAIIMLYAEIYFRLTASLQQLLSGGVGN